MFKKDTFFFILTVLFVIRISNLHELFSSNFIEHVWRRLFRLEPKVVRGDVSILGCALLSQILELNLRTGLFEIYMSFCR